MNIKEMHYDFKMKLNKIDSNQYRNLLVPEIDWMLNEAQELFVKMIAEPRGKSITGFETSQRSTEDIRSIVMQDVELVPVTDNNYDKTVYLPADYWYYLACKSVISKPGCGNKIIETKIRQHDDDFQNSPFDETSYDWETVNAVFYSAGMKFSLLDKGTRLTLTNIYLTYVKKPRRMHNAEDFRSGGYRLPGEMTTLTGTLDCELPAHTHREIVDIAALIATGNIQAADYQVKMAKLQLNDIKG